MKPATGKVATSRVVPAAILLFCLIAAASSAIADDPHICAHCGQAITSGKYITAEGKYYHEDHFLCAHCGKPIGSSRYVKHGGQPFHETCYTEAYAPCCAECGKPITGDYIEFKGNIYHELCYNTEHALRCSLCGKAINGQYHEDFWGNKTHIYHQDEYPSCEYCGRYIAFEYGRPGEKLGDGRIMCSRCLETAVGSHEEAKTLMEEARRHLAKHGIKVNTDDIPLGLLSKTDLNNQQGHGHIDPLGYANFFKKTRLGGLITQTKSEIFILDSLPRFRFIQTVAHELMHVWLFHHGQWDSDQKLVEGSCNLAAYLVLSEYDTPEAAYCVKSLIDDDDPVYGDGFRTMKNFTDTFGVRKWLEYLKQHSDLPYGTR